jgi:hypothetical protein
MAQPTTLTQRLGGPSASPLSPQALEADGLLSVRSSISTMDGIPANDVLDTEQAVAARSWEPSKISPRESLMNASHVR